MDKSICSQNFSGEHSIYTFKGNLFNSALHAAFVDLYCTPRISLIILNGDVHINQNFRMASQLPKVHCSKEKLVILTNQKIFQVMNMA